MDFLNNKRMLSPPHSADLDLIEHVWDQLGLHIIWRKPQPSNVQYSCDDYPHFLLFLRSRLLGSVDATDTIQCITWLFSFYRACNSRWIHWQEVCSYLLKYNVLMSLRLLSNVLLYSLLILYLPLKQNWIDVSLGLLWDINSIGNSLRRNGQTCIHSIQYIHKG